MVRRCDWSLCSSLTCPGCGPSIRMRSLAASRPICQVEVSDMPYAAYCYLYDGEDLYPDTQESFEPRLRSVSSSKCSEFIVLLFICV